MFNFMEEMKNFFKKETVAERIRREEVELKAQLKSVLPKAFKVKPLGGLFLGVVGAAKDKDSTGCITAVIINGREDYAVYPSLSIREVIASFKTKDGVAEANAIFVSSAARAVRVLLQGRSYTGRSTRGRSLCSLFYTVPVRR